MRDLSSHLSQVTNFDQIDENLTNFTLLMEKVCDPLFSRKVHSTPDFENIDTDKSPNQPWFDDDCRRFRKLFYSTLNFYRVDKSHDNRTRLVNARSEYKKLLRQKRYNYMKEKTCKLLVSKSKNVKEYWKLLKQASNLNNKCSINAKRFSEYFQAISDPNDSQMKIFYILMKDMCRENFRSCSKN